MADETFTERFNRLTKAIPDAEMMTTLGMSHSGLLKVRSGDTKTLKLHAALRLARKIGVSPWYLACEPEPPFDAVLQLFLAENPGHAMGTALAETMPPDRDEPRIVDLLVRIEELEAGLARVNERLGSASQQPAVEKTPHRPARRKQ